MLEQLFFIINLIKDMSKHHDRQTLRNQMGFCLQENIYYEDLTLLDHLEFIGRLRNIPTETRTHQVGYSAVYVKLYSFYCNYDKLHQCTRTVQ